MTQINVADLDGAVAPRVPVARTCPFHPPVQYEELRDRCPVARVGLPGGGTAWAVSRLADVRELLVSPSISADPRRPGFPDPYPEDGEDGSGEGSEDGDAPRLLLEMDVPEHTAYRRILIPELTVRRVNQLRPGIQALADGLVDDMPRHGPPVDLVTAFALPVPSTVICQLLGVPYGSHEFFQRHTETVVSKVSTGARKQAAYQELYDFLDALVTAEEAAPVRVSCRSCRRPTVTPPRSTAPPSSTSAVRTHAITSASASAPTSASGRTWPGRSWRSLGAGQCVLAAPELFDQDDDGIVTLLDAAPAAQGRAGARDAALLCPAVAIGVDSS